MQRPTQEPQLTALKCSTTASNSPCIVCLPVACYWNELKHELDTRQFEKNLCWLPVELCWTILNQELHHLYYLLMSIWTGLQGSKLEALERSQGLQTCSASPPVLGFKWKLCPQRAGYHCLLQIKYLLNVLFPNHWRVFTIVHNSKFKNNTLYISLKS